MAKIDTFLACFIQIMMASKGRLRSRDGEGNHRQINAKPSSVSGPKSDIDPFDWKKEEFQSQLDDNEEEKEIKT